VLVVSLELSILIAEIRMQRMLSLGRYTISTLVLDHFALDGGAMFGSVPKTLWSKVITPDERNRIPLCTRVLIIDGPDGRILVDCGNGDKWSDKERDIFDILPLSTTALRELIPNISHVVLTHLHFDHAAGATYKDAKGDLKLSFPGAVHYLQRENLERAMKPGIRERGSYLADTVEPIKKSNLKLLEDNQEIFPGISVHRSDGHTAGLQWILLRDQDGIVAYPSDLIPTANHVPIAWLMGYDLRAETTIEEKTKFLEQAESENWLIIFEHDRDTACGRVKRGEGGKYIFTREDDKQLSFG
jgi:glyoxylase-like metal-dependent hydrolase (beta-lactamase superfamily II)